MDCVYRRRSRKLMRAFGVDLIAWPAIRVKGSGGAGVEGALLGCCEQGQVG